ncbi:MAG: hypothetical protein FWE67_16015 [Planctomycetaceae bacterium]|nr:hypothetical protein [Planctomycetaceae bacterium]
MGWKYRVKQVLCRFIAVHKSIYYRLDRTLAQPSDNIAEFTTAASNEVSVDNVVRDLYGGNSKELAFYENYARQEIEHWSALLNGKVVGVVWLYTGYYLAQWEGYDAWLLHVETAPSAKFVCNVFTSPQSRGQRIFPLIAQRCFAEYPDNEFYSCIASNNKPSLRSHEKIGFRRCAVAYYVRFFQITFCYFITKTGQRRFFKLPKGKAVHVSLIDQ